jgi:tetratricopeptide (TPR) repeat protein
MKRCKKTIIAILLAVGLFSCAAFARQAGELLQEGLYAEETEGNIDAAIKVYEQIIKDQSAQRPHVAQAMYRLGMCYHKKQNDQKARTLLEQVVSQYSDQQEVVDKAQYLLDKISGPDPALLMPADTKVYIEVGNPGRRVETILKMLQGTPFANPIAAIVGGQGREKTPGDIIGALLNPSIVAEFKKIRGWAVGVTEIKVNNPPVIAVLYPGKSDALRGVILAALGVVGAPGEQIEGMSTLVFPNQMGGAAYDENVIIFAQPMPRLQWCVKQYKGITTEPTLATQNKTFAKLSRETRQDSAVTIWMDVAGAYSALKQQATAEGGMAQLNLVNGFVDFNSIEDIVIYSSIEEQAITAEVIVGLKEGHRCLAYDLIRTPNLSSKAFAAVPSDAVALASFALAESQAGSIDTAQKTVRKLTGLDVGRELFANIEQINVFVVPPAAGATTGGSPAANVISSLALAITSHDPARTRALLEQLLAIGDMAARTAVNKQSGEQANPAEGKYLMGGAGGKEMYCYLGQADKTTVLAFSPQVLKNCIDGIANRKSAVTAGPLQKPLSEMPANTSKMLVVSAGGAMRVADAQIRQIYNNQQNPAHQTFAQLAQAFDNTTVRFQTVETVNGFRVRFSINNLPPVASVFPLFMQLSQLNVTAQAKATNPQPADGAIVRPGEQLKLDWQSGAGAVSHKVYFGADKKDLSMLGEVNKPDEVRPPAMKDDAAYYWRVDEVWADGNAVTGDVWTLQATGKLLGWWKMDEQSGQTAADSSGNGAAGLLKGNPKWTQGKLGGALEFDGDGDYIEIANESKFDVAGQLTIACWIKVNKFDKNFQTIVTKGNQDGWVLHRNVEEGTLGFACAGLSPQTWVLSTTAVNDGQWHHIVAVYDGSKLRIYTDGKLDSSVNATGTITVNNSPVCIGENLAETGRFWNGLIDDLRIYNYALSADDVKSLYEIAAAAPQPADGGIVGAAGEIRPSWKPAAGAASHKVYFGTAADNLTLLAEVSNTADAKFPKLQENAVYYWRVDEVLSDGSTIKGNVWSFTASGKLLGWWKFDETEGRDVADSSGNNNAGKIAQGTPKWQPSGGKIGGALLFDGADDYVQIANEQNFDLTNQMTVACWIKVNKFDREWQAVVTKGDSAWRLHRVGDSVAFHTNGLSTSSRQWGGTGVEGKTSVNDGQWHHVASVYNGTKVLLYIDGRLDASVDTRGKIDTNNEPVFIGENSQTKGRCFNGLVDDVRIYNYPLSEPEISALAGGR